MTGRVIAETTGAIGTLIFDNPEKRNAVSLEMWREADAALADFSRDSTIRILIVTGAGDWARRRLAIRK